MFKYVESISIKVSDSSLVSNIEWTNKRGSKDKIKDDLTITFNQNDERYEYIGVPSTTLQEMLESDSIGKYFHANIKDQYETYKEI